jgi:segregation and condensation protein B
MPLIFPKEAMAILDALIFASPQPLPVSVICQITGFDRTDADNLLSGLEELYNQAGHGLQLVQVAGGYQLVTRPEYHDYIQKLQQSKAKEPPLSQPALETLSIVAYCQPVTRAKIESIRGIKVDHVLYTLLDRNLITECGRAEGPGRPILYATTQTFLELFGLKSLADLPDRDSLKQL